MRGGASPGDPERPRLTPRGAMVLMVVYLAVGPVSAFGIGIPLAQLNNLILWESIGRYSGIPEPAVLYGLANTMLSLIVIVVGLPFYGLWAELSLWPMAAWIAATVVLIATTRRGPRVGDAALAAAAAVLVYPALVDADSPHLTWTYPDALYMALAAAGGAALCTALVRGFGRRGLLRRRAWGWIA